MAHVRLVRSALTVCVTFLIVIWKIPVANVPMGKFVLAETAFRNLAVQLTQLASAALVSLVWMGFAKSKTVTPIHQMDPVPFLEKLASMGIVYLIFAPTFPMKHVARATNCVVTIPA